MAFDLLLDTVTHDLDISGLKTKFTVDDDGSSLIQKLRITLLTNLKEWYFNESIGVPYLRSTSDQFQHFILSDKSNDISIVDSIFRDVIINTEGVSQLVEFNSSIDPESRTYTFSFTVTDVNNKQINLTLVT